MSGPAIPLLLAMLLNLWIAWGWFVKHDYALAFVFFCYAASTAAFLYKDLTT